MNNYPLKKKWLFLALLAGTVVMLFFAGPVLTPFIISLILAYILDPLVDRLEALGLPRSLAVFFFLICLVFVLASCLVFILPIIKLQIEQMAKNLPGYVQTAQGLIMPWVTMFTENQENFRELAKDTLLKMGSAPIKALSSVVSFFWRTLSGFVDFTLMLVNLVVIPVATFYLLRDIDRVKEKVVDIIPLDIKDNVLLFCGKIHEVLSNFIRGQLIVASILAAIYAIGLTLVGIPLSLPIGILAGLANIVPYLGLVLGLVPALILAYLQFHDLAHPLMVCGIFGFAQVLEGMVITPKIVGEKLGLHPVVIMLAVLLGGQLFGFTGILISVPVAAAINVFFTEGLDTYKKSEVYLGPAPSSVNDCSQGDETDTQNGKNGNYPG